MTVTRRALLLSAVLLAGVTSACGGTDEAAPAADRTVVDVRTPAEFATGHVRGARNLDVEAPDFDTAVAALPKDATYLVYCHSGRRAGIAVERMTAAGLRAASGGGIEDMRAAGWEIVTG